MESVEMQIAEDLPAVVSEMWQDPPAEMHTEGEEMLGLWRELPGELLSEVAKHLPVSAILRFRCVAKSWSKPRLKPEAVAGLHIRKTVSKYRRIYSLHSKKKLLSLLKLLPSRIDYFDCLGCVNGLLAFSGAPGTSSDTDGTPVHFEITNVFTGCAWTVLRPPAAPGRDPVFTGLSKLPGPGGLLHDVSVGEKLSDDYLLVAGMAEYHPEEISIISLLLQVFRGGLWSSSLLRVPDGNFILFSGSGEERFAVLRGSIFYFLLARLDNNSATLACTDLLSPHKPYECITVCNLEPDFVCHWEPFSFRHPKPAVCSGKLLLVHGRRVPGKRQAYTTCIEVLDEEQKVWRLEASLPEELRGDDSFWPRGISDGGDELVISDHLRKKTFSYHLVSKAWSRVHNTRDSCTHADKIGLYTA